MIFRRISLDWPVPVVVPGSIQRAASCRHGYKGTKRLYIGRNRSGRSGVDIELPAKVFYKKEQIGQKEFHDLLTYSEIHELEKVFVEADENKVAEALGAYQEIAVDLRKYIKDKAGKCKIDFGEVIRGIENI